MVIQEGSTWRKSEVRRRNAEEKTADCRFFAAGRVIAAPVTTMIADGVAVRVPDEDALEIILENVDHIVRVSDDEAREAMRIYFTATHNTVEGAGALALAAALKERDTIRGKRVALVVSGGNVDREVFAKILMD